MREKFEVTENNYRIIFSADGKDEEPYFTLSQLSERVGYHPVYLRRLLIDGKLQGKKIQLGGGEPFWVTTERAIQEYESTKKPTGRPKNQPTKNA